MTLPVRRLLALRRDPLNTFDTLARAHGDIVRLPVPCQPIYLIAHPDLVKELLVTQAARFGRGLAIQRAQIVLGQGLLTSDGDAHLRHRRIMQPSFSQRDIEAHVPAIAAAVIEHRARWADGASVDVAREMAVMMLAVVAKVLFGQEIGASVSAIAGALDELLDFSNRLVLPGSGIWTTLPTPATRRARAALATLDAVLYDLIDRRRRRGPGRDVLSALMHARDPETGGAGLTDRQLRDETMTLLLAGHETTACALTWTWYLLAMHPEIDDRLRRDVRTVLDDRPPVEGQIASLRYAEQVLAEAMRLFPPVWSVGRRALEDLTIGGTLVPKGALVVASQWTIQRDQRFWPDPLRFDPDRFAGADRPRRPRPAYFPFGDGPRRCIGESLAWTVGVTTLSALVGTTRFTPMPATAIAPLSYLFLLYPGHRPASARSSSLRRGLPMHVHRA